MIARALSVLAFAIAIVACASIDAPAPFDEPEAGSDPSVADGGPFDRCRVLPRTFAANATAKVYGDPSGAQAVCVTLDLDVQGGGSGSVAFCVAGNLDTASLKPPRVESARRVDPDLGTCAYCVDVQTGCSDGNGDAGSPRSCTVSYAPTQGTVRFVKFSRTPGDQVWIDIGKLVVARVEQRDGGGFVLQPADCLFADGLTFQGTLVAGSSTGCSGLEATACEIASTAVSRVP